MSKTLSLILLLYSSIFFTTRAGFPAIIDPLGTLFVTTLPAPTIQSSPIFTPGSINALAPINVLLPILTIPNISVQSGITFITELS